MISIGRSTKNFDENSNQYQLSSINKQLINKKGTHTYKKKKIKKKKLFFMQGKKS